MRDSILFDVECLERGLPPMSGNVLDVVQMVMSSNPSTRRKISRKLKKLAKSEITRRCLKVPHFQQKVLQERLKAHANIGPQKTGFRKRDLAQRIIMACDFINYSLEK